MLDVNGCKRQQKTNASGLGCCSPTQGHKAAPTLGSSFPGCFTPSSKAIGAVRPLTSSGCSRVPGWPRCTPGPCSTAPTQRRGLCEHPAPAARLQTSSSHRHCDLSALTKHQNSPPLRNDGKSKWSWGGSSGPSALGDRSHRLGLLMRWKPGSRSGGTGRPWLC